VAQVCARLRAPKRHSELARNTCLYHTHCHRALELRGKTVLKLLNNTDALRRPDRFENFLLACEADARGRLGLEQRDYPQADYLRQALATAQNISAAQFADSDLTGKALGQAISAERVQALEALRPD
jgi:tRNA nucleotidyltransferase (CCA-adding enzyme)